MKKIVLTMVILSFVIATASCGGTSGTSTNNSAAPGTPVITSASPVSPSTSNEPSETAAETAAATPSASSEALIPEDAVWSGEWKRMDTGRFASATLVIFNETKSGFEFQIDAFNASHMGFIGGTAVIDGSVAHFKDKETSAELVFSLENGVIDAVSKGDIFYYAGANVIFDGRYTQEALPEDTLLSMGYVPDKARDDAMRAMTGEDYELFLNTAQISGDNEDMDGFGAEVHSWWVSGFAGSNESIVMLLPDGKICAAVIDPDGSKFKVYTDAEYITDIPKTIEEWIVDMQDLLNVITDIPVEFYNTIKN